MALLRCKNLYKNGHRNRTRLLFAKAFGNRAVVGAWHWNKKYWNEVHFDADVPDDLVFQLIDHSLAEVLKKMPKKLQVEYAAISSF